MVPHPPPMRHPVLLSLLVLIALPGCDLFGSDGLLGGPDLEVDDGSTLDVDFGPTGTLRFTIPDSLSLSESTVATYTGTIEVTHRRLPNERSGETLWRVVCPEARLIGDTIDYGVVPDGCEQETAPSPVLPGRPAAAFAQGARVDAFGNVTGRRASAAFQMNDAAAVASVEPSGASVTISWRSSVAGTFGELLEAGVHKVTSAEGEPTRIASNRVWSFGCDPLADASGRPTSVTPGGAVPAGCFGFPDTVELEPGRYVAVVSLRETAFATLFEL